MPVRVSYSTGVKDLTPDAAVTWAGQEVRAIRNDNNTGDILPIFLEHWNKTYLSTEYRMFLKHLKMYVEQFELLRGIRDLGEKIVSDYPANVYLYVGVGRSPAPLIAYFQNTQHRTLTIPLSSFRPRSITWSITDEGLPGQQRISQAQQQTLFAHFARYFPARPPRPRILLIDYTQTAQSLLAAQEQLQAFFRSQQQMQNIEVHALALCRDSDEPAVRSLRVTIGTPRNLWHPIDWWSYSAQRQIFAQRWHVLPIAKWLEFPQTQRQQLVMQALSGQAFDELAEYGSFQILTAGPGAQPTRYTNDPNQPAAYDVLRKELRNL